ncbi:glutathione S-transferase PARB-like [Castanea sativa]|uniref:glutathione S-transferase PARB-like n=1 Tax=Castanea sativa TaxID=21020 RepID=UPI003F64B5AF
MSAIKVHGNPLSTATMRVLATPFEKELDHEFVIVDLRAGEHKKEHFLSRNYDPYALTFCNSESRAVTKYIAYEYADKGTQLIYQDPKKMAITSVWMEVDALQYDKIATTLGLELGYKPVVLGINPDATVVEENEPKLAKVLDIYGSRLVESKYLGGDYFTLADLHHMPIIHFLLGTQTKKLF